MGNANRKRIKLPSGLELVMRHIAAVVHREDGGVTVCVDGFGQYCLTGDAAAFRDWWDAPKAKRVKADSSGFIGTDMCECGHNWGEHILRGAPADACGQCGCRSFSLATEPSRDVHVGVTPVGVTHACGEPEPPAEPKRGPWAALMEGDNGGTARVMYMGDTALLTTMAYGFSAERNALADRVATLLNESEVAG